jgi:hypothetical protein
VPYYGRNIGALSFSVLQIITLKFLSLQYCDYRRRRKFWVLGAGCGCVDEA